MFKTRALVLAAALLAVSGASYGLDVESAIKTRQEFYKEMGKAFKGLTEDLKGGNPAPDELKKYAAVIEAHAGKIPALFPAGTSLDSGFKTGAKPEIWAKWDEFQRDAGAFDGAALALNAAAQSGDIPTVGKAAQAVGEACKTCHETFRAKEH